MENLKILDDILRNESLFKGRIFTELQLGIIRKRANNKRLDMNEKTYYYKFIKPKIKAIMEMHDQDEMNIYGRENILDARISKSIEIIKRLQKKHKNKKILVSGSFLFNKKYQDIDVFIFTKYQKEEYKKGKIHVIFLPELALDSLFFNSLSQISVANFTIAQKNKFDLELADLLQTYELLINAMLNKEEYEKKLRDLLVQMEYYSKRVILSPKQLYDLKEKLSRKNIGIISNVFINVLIIMADKNLKDKLRQHIQDYRKLKNDYKNSRNVDVYLNTYQRVMDIAS